MLTLLCVMTKGSHLIRPWMVLISFNEIFAIARADHRWLIVIHSIARKSRDFAEMFCKHNNVVRNFAKQLL